jgi:hypothetical protein
MDAWAWSAYSDLLVIPTWLALSLVGRGCGWLMSE